jgi:hypothetical protein
MAEKQPVDVNTIVLSKTVQFEGREYKELFLDVDSLTGNDIEQAESQFIAQNPQIAAQTALKELSKGFQAILAAKATKVPVELIKALPAKDYSKITTKIQNFLLTGE